MKYFVNLKENSTRVDFCGESPLEGYYEVETNIEYSKIPYCDYINGQLVYNEDYIGLEIIDSIRERREKYCFSIINRGQPWYNTLSTEQLVEIQTWYQAWLDAPQTLVEPEKPSWIKE